MAKHLGFFDYEALKYWADKNPTNWGNGDGDFMDTMLCAYNGLEDDSINPMSIIIKHWEDVRGKL